MECPHKRLAEIIATAPAYYHAVALELQAIDPTHIRAEDAFMAVPAPVEMDGTVPTAGERMAVRWIARNAELAEHRRIQRTAAESMAAQGYPVTCQGREYR